MIKKIILGLLGIIIIIVLIKSTPFTLSPLIKLPKSIDRESNHSHPPRRNLQTQIEQHNSDSHVHDIGDTKANKDSSVKTVINIGHLSQINIIHDIDDRLIATYSEGDRSLKVFEKATLLLIREYGIAQARVQAIFSIKGLLYLKTPSHLYQIDLINNIIKEIISDANLSTNFIISQSYIVFAVNTNRYVADLLAFDYINNRIVRKEERISTAGGQIIDSVYFSGEIYAIETANLNEFVFFDQNLNKTSFSHPESTSESWLPASFRDDFSVVEISRDIGNKTNISPHRFMAQGINKYRETTTMHKDDKYVVMGIGNTRSAAFSTSNWFFHYNKKDHSLSYLIKTEENLSGLIQQEFSTFLVDAENRIAVLKGSENYTVSGDQYFAVIGFDGGFFGFSKVFSLYDNIDIEIIGKYIFVVNDTTKKIYAYDLRDQVDLSGISDKLLLEELISSVFSRRDRIRIDNVELTESDLRKYFDGRHNHTAKLNESIEAVLSEKYGVLFHHVMKHNLGKYEYMCAEVDESLNMETGGLARLIESLHEQTFDVKRLDKYDERKTMLTFGSAQNNNDLQLTPLRTFRYDGPLSKVDLEGAFFYATTTTGVRYQYDLTSGALLTMQYRVDQDTDVVLTPEGYFSGKGDLSHFIYFEKDLEIITFNQLYDVFYRPDIVEVKSRGIDIGPLISLTVEEALNNPPPNVKITPCVPDVKSQRISISYEIENGGGGIGDIRVFHNGKLIKSDGFYKKVNMQTLYATLDKMNSRAIYDYSRAIKATFHADDEFPSRGQKNRIKGIVKIDVLPGENEVSICAFNHSNSVQSAIKSVRFRGAVTLSEPYLHILAVGIDKYRDESQNLLFATKDAKDLSRTLSFVSGSLYPPERVRTTLLVDEAATKNGIVETIKKLTINVKVNDVFVLFVASHGIIMGDQYYIVTHDYDGLLTNECLLSSNEIVDHLKVLKAIQQLVILDTCHAGGIDYMFSGLYDTRISILAKRVGLHVYASSSSREIALDGYRGNGLFTHCLLKGLDNKKEADKNNDKNISVIELGNYVAGLTEATGKELNHSQQPKIINFGHDFSMYRLK